MYNLSDKQCFILKKIGEHAQNGNHTAVLYSSDIKQIPEVERILQDFTGKSLLRGFKAFTHAYDLSSDEIIHLRKVYGDTVFRSATTDGYGYLVFIGPIFEEDWDYLARSIKAHDRIKKHGGIRYELKYRTDNKYVLNYYDYAQGLKKEVKKIYDDTAIEALLDCAFGSRKGLVTSDDLRGKKSKNISQIINSLGLPKVIRDLFFREITCDSVRFFPVVDGTVPITYDEEAMRYLEDAEEI